MRRIRDFLLIFLFLVLILSMALVTYASLTDYTPDEAEIISSYDFAPPLSDTTTFSIINWNIGYAGLGEQMDFFYDGGENIRDTEDNVRRNMYRIASFLKDADTVDFILLQEVDKNAKRSYSINEHNWLDKKLIDFFPYYATNYKVQFVPVPVSSPMGKVESGLLTFSKNTAASSVRVSFPGNYSWPTKLFMLDRCFLVNQYPLPNGKSFILVNTHNSAYDDGSLRKIQMDYLKSYLLQQEAIGNYVLVGGDWNQCPADFKPQFDQQIFDTILLSYIERDYPNSNWQWAFDSKTPSNRRVETPYHKKSSPTTVIDFYLASSNIDIIAVKTIDLQFENSDHNPVILTFKFN